MAEPALTIYFDYVDPLSYLVQPALARLEERGVEVRHRPLERNPPPSPLLDPDAPALRRWWEDEIEPLAAREGVEIRRPAFIPWSRKAHELALHARQEGCFQQVHGALFRAHFVERRDIGRIDVLVELGVEAGMDVTDTRVALDVDARTDELLRQEAEAASRGVETVPTTVIDGRRIEGYATAEDLDSLLRDAPPPDGRGRTEP